MSASFVVFIDKPVNPNLLISELNSIEGVNVLTNLGTLRLQGERNISHFNLEISTTLPLVQAAQTVDDAISIHVADRGPGPVGFTSAELRLAWAEIGREIAAEDPTLAFFRKDFTSFLEDLNSKIGTIPQNQINFILAKMLYLVARLTGMPMPNSYDPFDEANLVGDDWIPL